MKPPLRLRIKTFKYTTTIRGTTSIAGLRDHGLDLLDCLDRDREDDPSAILRPLIFVGHSLGGMIIKSVSAGCSDAFHCNSDPR